MEISEDYAHDLIKWALASQPLYREMITIESIDLRCFFGLVPDKAHTSIIVEHNLFSLELEPIGDDDLAYRLRLSSETAWGGGIKYRGDTELPWFYILWFGPKMPGRPYAA